jgi:hypothetical protein
MKHPLRLMTLTQAIETLDQLILLTDDFPVESDWQTIEEAIAILRQAIVSNQTLGYSTKMLKDLASTARVTLALAKAGGSATIATALANEKDSMFTWLDEVLAS